VAYEGTGEAVPPGLLPLQGLTAQALLDALPFYALSARQWDATGVVGEPEPEGSALLPA